MFPLENLDPGWAGLFEDNRMLLEDICTQVEKKPFLPAAPLVFRFTQTPLDRVRVVILGQDPYPQPGAATGRSFEVAGLHSWAEPFRQSSLRNILRAVYAAETGELLPWQDVRARIADGRFRILPPDRLWDNLEAQGVLFLNAYLTVAPGKPGAHRALWQEFARRTLGYIDQFRPGTDFFLWGSDARSYAPQITHGRRWESRHPMMTGPWPDDFLKNPCFRETRGRICWCPAQQE